MWEPKRLGDVLRIRHGYAFSGMSADVPAPAPVVVGIGNFDYAGGFRFGSTTVKRFLGDYPSEFELAPGDLLLAMTCQTPGGEILGIPGRIPDDGNVYLHNQRLGKVEILDPDELDLGYVFQLARWPRFNRHLFVTASGSKILHTSPSRIEEFEFELPPLDEQRSIAELLGALDDKIECNRRAVDLGEAIGDALFAAAATGVATLSDVAALIMGSSPPGSSYNEDGIGLPFYQGVRDFGRRIPGLRVWTTEPRRMAEPNDTLVSVRAPVGDLNRASVRCCIGRGVAAIRSRTPSTLFYALRASTALWEPFQQEGTVFGAINRTDLAAAKLAWPSSSSIEETEARLSCLDDKIASLTQEIRQLADLREALLPELMSGRIRVPEAVAVVQDGSG